MSCDSYYEIGKSHIACQDYALHGSLDGFEYGIVADGCSSANHSEIGAQMLCHAAKYQIGFCIRTGLLEKSNIKIISSVIGNGVFKRANEVIMSYPITRETLEATLLIAIRVSSKVLVFAWGDGVIIANYEKGDNSYYQTIMKIDYSLNAPFYLACNDDIYLKNCQKKGESNPQCFRETYTLSEEKGLSDPVKYSYPFNEIYMDKCASMVYSMERLVSVTICTDGISSYRNGFKKDIGLETTVPEFIGFKNTTGEFVKKRMIFFGKKVTKNNWHHYDDVGTATIYLNKE